MRKTVQKRGIMLLLCLVLMTGLTGAETLPEEAAPADITTTAMDAVALAEDVTEPVTVADTPIPVTDAPVTDAPVTDAPVTEAPATEAPATDAPTQAPTDAPADTDVTVPPDVAETEPPDEGPWTRTDDSAMDVRDVLANLGIDPASIIDGFALTFAENGEQVDTPTLDADITMTFDILLPEGVPAQLRPYDYYLIDRPDTMAATGAHVIDLTEDDVTFAQAEVESGPLRIRFLPGVEGFDSLNTSFTVSAAFAPEAYAPGETVTLTLPGEEAGSVTFTMAGDAADAEAEGPPAQAEIIGQVTPEPAETEAPVMIETRAASIGLVTDYTVQYLTNGLITGTPIAASALAPTLTLTMNNDVAQAIAAGDNTYTIALPNAMAIASQQAISVTTGGGDALATAAVNTDKTITLTFAPGADALVGQSGALLFDAAFDPAVVTQQGTYSLSLPGETSAPAISAKVYETAPDPGTTGWTRTTETDMDVKDIFTNLGISPASIISGIHLTYEAPGSGTPSDTEATLDSLISFDTSLYIPASVTENMRNGDTYTIQVPPEISVVAGETFDLTGGPDGTTVYGTVVVGTDGTVTVTFNDNVQTLGNATGSFHFTGEFDKSQINTPGDHVIKVPNEPDNISTTVHINSNVDQAINKTGTPDQAYNGKQITWNVDFNKPMDTLNGAVITDTIPAGLTLDQAATKVYVLNVDVDGNVLGVAGEYPAGSYTVGADGTVTFTGPVTQAVRVEYVTDITADTTAGGVIPFVNNAALTTGDGTNLTTNATVSVRYGNFLDKKNLTYDPATQEFTWQIQYNYGEQTIDQADATLTDTLTGPGMVFDQSSLTLQHVTVDQTTGVATVDGPYNGPFVPTYNGNNMVITFGSDVTDAILITYTTRINGFVDENGVPYGNDVSTTWGGKTHASGDAKPSQQQNIIKSVNALNDVSKNILWKVDVNKNGYWMKNWYMTDTMGQGLHFDGADSVAITDTTSGAILAQGTDFQVQIVNDSTFRISFMNTYAAGTSDTFLVVYSTSYDETAPQTVANTVTGNWTDASDNPHSSTNEGHYPRTPVDVDNGMKYGVYNAVTKRITWYVLANYHLEQVNPGVLVDPIQGDQVYVPGSLRFYEYQAGVQPEAGPALDGDSIGFVVTEPSATNNQTLTIRYDGNPNSTMTAAVWGVFETTLEGQVINASGTYDNEATLTVNGNDHTLHGQVTVTHGGEFVDKDGQQERDGYVHWQAVINPSQSTLADVVVTDTPSVNQRIDITSVTVYRTQVATNGTITATNAVLERNVDYTVSYAPDAGGTWIMTVTFLHDIEEPYVLSYRSSLYLSTLTGTVTNNIRVDSSTSITGGKTTDNTSKPVQVVEGGGVIYGKPGKVTLRKMDASGAGVLPGAVLELEDALGHRIGPVTVDATGLVTFDNIVQGTYKLYELAAPVGYSISQELANGMTVQVTDATTNGTTIIPVANALTEATLKKTDEAGTPLAGAVFHLEQLDTASGSYAPYGTDTYTSGSDGIVRVTGLPEGQYRFVEDTAPDGYVKNTAMPTFTLAADANGVIAPADAGTLVNYQTTLRMLKVNTNGDPLPGAVFRITNLTNGTVVGDFTTGADGYLNVPGIGPGAYRIVEVTPPAGYTSVTDPADFTIPAEAGAPLGNIQLNRATNERTEGSVILQKVDGDTNTALAGAVFEIKDATGSVVGRITTTDGGWGEYDGLAVGTYTITEVTAPAGYVLDTTETTFEVTDATYNAPFPQTLGTFNNHKGRARLLKTNEEGTALAGATFTLHDTDGTLLGNYVTDVDGVIELYTLSPGGYVLTEVQAPVGHELSATPIHFLVPSSGIGRLEPVSLATTVNKRMNGVVAIYKRDAANGMLLRGAVYNLVNKETGAVVATVTTDDGGVATVGNLQSGTYQFVEVTPPFGYLLDSTPIEVVVADGQTAVASVTQYDQRQPGVPTPTPSPRPTLPPEGPPQTGDGGNGGLYLLMGLAGLALVGALAVRIGWRRRAR